MKNYQNRIVQSFFVLFFLTIEMSVFSQVDDDNLQNKTQNMNIEYESEASYPGGLSNFIADVWSLMEYSQEAIDAKIDTQIMISFDVLPDSSISGIEILTPVGMGVDEELERVLKTMKFIPAVAEGNQVKMNVIHSIPLRTGPKSKLKKQ
ncbi:MAG: energy transducer TonB [Bacteroidales bacterium]|nr:energy transducer TonB [Bacteroidales bacterium]MDD4235655.1 energy transducer TonB [Bacteroidales bacterium]